MAEAENPAILICQSRRRLRRFTFVQHSVGRLVPSQGLFGQVLVGLSQTFHLGEASVESHGRVTGVLGHVQVGRTPQLLLDHQRLLQQLHRDMDK